MEDGIDFNVPEPDKASQCVSYIRCEPDERLQDPSLILVNEERVYRAIGESRLDKKEIEQMRSMLTEYDAKYKPTEGVNIEIRVK